MLEKLIIENIALIDYAEIDFTKGLNVLSGETGAGKSVILESLNFVLGGKADKSMIRNGQTQANVTAVFNISDCSFFDEIFAELEIDGEEQLIITRKLNFEGKNTIKLNGFPVTAGMLKKFTSKLVDVHGQSEHYQLLSLSNQLKLVDSLGEDKILSLKKNIKDIFTNYKQLISEINELGGDNQSQRLLKLDILNFQINEIENSGLYEGEEEELIQNKNQLQHREKLLNALNMVKNSINEEGGVCDVLSNSIRPLNNLLTISKKYQDLYNRLNQAYSDLVDCADTASDFISDVGENELDIDQIEDRLDVIKSLKKKYGNSYSEINEFLTNAYNEKDKLENFSKNSELLLLKKKDLEKELYNYYLSLSKERKSVSLVFEKNVINELKELGMKSASFQILFTDIPDFENCSFDSANGFDNLTFLFSANSGEPLKSLSSVISGGEMSRFMLSIKAQSAKYNEIDTFVFDEIDAGISGVTAQVVAEKFAKISRDVQVIAITHLPQISSMADNNLLIEKVDDGKQAHTTVKTLNSDQKIDEIARLVGGLNSSSARILAKELVDFANNYKNNL